MAATERLAGLSESFREVARVASPSVVQVSVEVRPRRRSRRPPIAPEQMEELLRRFGPLLGRDPELRQFFRDRLPEEEDQPDFDQYNIPVPIGNASGWLYDDQGHVVTSPHVVAQAEQITVTFHDETEAEAELVGSDPPTDVAVLKVDREGLPPATMATRNVEQGDIVLAIGAPFRYAFSVSQGIVSATERQVGILGPHGYENFIQTDAAINPGNSGGPLINGHGEVVGMCTAIASRSGAFAGLGFATPVDMIRDVVEALIRDGIVKRGYLGAVISDDSRLLASFGAERGVLIEDMVEGAPGEEAGLRPGDVVAAAGLRRGIIIVAVQGREVTDVDALREAVEAQDLQEGVRMRVQIPGGPARFVLLSL